MINGHVRIRLVHRNPSAQSPLADRFIVVVDPVTLQYRRVSARRIGDISAPCDHCRVSVGRMNWTELQVPVECEECFDGSNLQPLG